MKVAVMGRSLRGRLSGVGRYAAELIRSLAPRLAGDLTVLLTRTEDGLDGLAIQKIRAPFPTPDSGSRILWEQLVVPVTVWQLRPQVYHSPNYVLPVALTCPTVVTVHDADIFNRTFHRWRTHAYLAVITTLALRKASRVICVSRHTQSELATRFPWAAAKLRHVPEGVSGRFAPQSPDTIGAFRRRYGLSRPYVLFVGTIEPRKNLSRLIRAFSAAVGRTQTGHELLLVGAPGWKWQGIRQAYETSPVRDRIRFLGYLPDEDLPAAYSGAEIFAFPSLAEGFGLPVLEAMSCGTPVITSTAAALVEVAGDAALTVDPGDEKELALGLARFMTSPSERDAAVLNGLRRVAAFRWEHAAEQTLKVYQEVA